MFLKILILTVLTQLRLLVMLRRMLSDSASSTIATYSGSAYAYKCLPSREYQHTEIHIERMNNNSGAGLYCSYSYNYAVMGM